MRALTAAEAALIRAAKAGMVRQLSGRGYTVDGRPVDPATNRLIDGLITDQRLYLPPTAGVVSWRPVMPTLSGWQEAQR